MIVSPFTRKHYVSHTPMDHTAVIKFVEARFIGQGAHLTGRDAAQPDLLEFFDFTNIPWATPPTDVPVPPRKRGESWVQSVHANESGTVEMESPEISPGPFRLRDNSFRVSSTHWQQAGGFFLRARSFE